MDNPSQWKPSEFNALTIIDTISNLVELVRIDDKMSAYIAKKYAQVWLSQYPWPERCVHDNGGSSKVVESRTFQPQAKIHKQMQSVNACICLHTLLREEPPKSFTKAKDFIDKALSIAMHTM